MVNDRAQVEYIWLDGYEPQELRSKTKIVPVRWIEKDLPHPSLNFVPEWGFDGSSTKQAEGRLSDCKLKPVFLVLDPMRGWPNLLALCEVLNPDGSTHPTNQRVKLRQAMEKYKALEPWIGVEQEYTLYKGDAPLGFVMQNNNPQPQGRNYCGVGEGVIFGRELIEVHTKACLDASLHIAGTNSEVMPGQWEFQVGPLNSLDPLNPLRCADELWVARWLLKRFGENYGISISFAPKPVVDGDWNGAGAHTNFSTKAMRGPNGLEAVKKAAKKLEKFHHQHIAVYGKDNLLRLTGKHETCDINTFRYGESDRGASIRIPMATLNAGCGYLEDRRPAANMDPYQVLTALLETVCGEGFRGLENL